MTFNFSEECEEYQVSEQLARKIDEKLFPLLEIALIRNPTFNMFLSNEMHEANRMIINNFAVFQQLFDKVKAQLELEPKELAVIFSIDYLIKTESLFTHIVDVIALTLISNGMTLTAPRTEKEIVLPDEIRLVPLGTKLDFLKGHGFPIIANSCCVRLRNSSAHLSYTIDNAGNIHLPQGDIIKIFDGMNEYHDKLRDVAIGGHIALRHFYYEKYGKNKA